MRRSLLGTTRSLKTCAKTYHRDQLDVLPGTAGQMVVLGSVREKQVLPVLLLKSPSPCLLAVTFEPPMATMFNVSEHAASLALGLDPDCPKTRHRESWPGDCRVSHPSPPCTNFSAWVLFHLRLTSHAGKPGLLGSVVSAMLARYYCFLYKSRDGKPLTTSVTANSQQTCLCSSPLELFVPTASSAYPLFLCYHGLAFLLACEPPTASAVFRLWPLGHGAARN